MPNNLLRSSPETGPAKVRRRGNARPCVIQANYVMTEEELSIFRAFAMDTLAGGAICFDWPHPVLNRTVRARLVANGDGLYTESFFGSTLEWQVALTIEYWPDAPVNG